MTPARLVRTSLAALGRHPVRSAAMTLGSFVGTAALTFVLTIGASVQQKILATVRQLFGSSSIVVSGGCGFFMGGPRSATTRLTLDDAAALAAALPDIDAWDPMQVLPGAQVRHGEAQATVRLLGQSERAPRVWDRGVSRGEFFDASTVASSARVALVGETAARELFGQEDPVGAEVLIGSAPFRVTGVLDALGTDIHGMDRDDEIVIPVSTAMRRVMNVDSIRAVKLLVRDPGSVDATARAAARLLRQRHAIAEGQPDDFTIVTSSSVQRTIGTIRSVLFLYLPLVAGLSLVVGGAVAAALMLATVNERVSEIGLRRAVGARPDDIRRQFLFETCLTALGGGAVGAALGTGLAFLLASRMSLAVAPSLGAVVLGLLLSAATGLVAGVLPARRAARLEPATALR